MTQTVPIELRAATGLGGRHRALGDDHERARRAVTARIRESIARLRQLDRALGDHLERGVETGSTCVRATDAAPRAVVTLGLAEQHATTVAPRIASLGAHAMRDPGWLVRYGIAMVAHDVVATRFAEKARRFLALVTATDLAKRDRLDVLRAVIPMLGDLLAALLSLPDVSDDDLSLGQPAASGPYRPAIERCLGDWDRYREVFDPNAADEDENGQGAVVGASISDDLADVAHDLTGGLEALAAGRPSEAIRHWRFTGTYHWGAHAVDALRSATWRVLAAMQDQP